MTTDVTDNFPVNGRMGYRVIPWVPAEAAIDHNGRYWCVRPSGMAAVIYVASKEDAEECLRGVLEGLR